MSGAKHYAVASTFLIFGCAAPATFVKDGEAPRPMSPKDPQTVFVYGSNEPPSLAYTVVGKVGSGEIKNVVKKAAESGCEAVIMTGQFGKKDQFSGSCILFKDGPPAADMDKVCFVMIPLVLSTGAAAPLSAAYGWRCAPK